MPPPWDVLLLGGPSGVGNSMIAFELSRRFEATLTAVDDVYVAVQRMTSPAEHPELHRWETEPEVIVALDDEGMLIVSRRSRGTGTRDRGSGPGAASTPARAATVRRA